MAQTYLSDILHVVAQWLMVPDIILLLLFIAYALFCIGSVVAEFFTERRHFKVVMPKFLNDLMEADEDGIPDVVKGSGLLNRQKQALLTVYEYRTLPGDALLALIRRLMSEEESRYDRVVGRNNTAARVAPMIGLMGTLIPLGPGIEALGRADTAALSSSLLVAFDTTVAGLVVAAVCLVIGKIRSRWYEDYLSALDSAMATMLEKVEGMRDPSKAEAPRASKAQAPDSSSDDELYSEFERMLQLEPMPEFNPKSKPVLDGDDEPKLLDVLAVAPASEAEDLPAEDEAAMQRNVQPAIEPKKPISISFEPLKDPLENQSDWR